MQFLGRLLDTVSSVSTLFTNPYRVKEVPLGDYSGTGRVQLRQEGQLVLYKNSPSQSWDCVLLCPETPTLALRSVFSFYVFFSGKLLIQLNILPPIPASYSLAHEDACQ
uniref:Uncharacterized protein n=1 Tax=Periophthalmus magnuspinnatus TaxID=409849 RepID=A0A3B4B511_9GOBI